MGKWANKSGPSATHREIYTHFKEWLNPAGLQASALFSLLTNTFGSVRVNWCVCVCVCATQYCPLHQTTPHPATRPPRHEHVFTWRKCYQSLSFCWQRWVNAGGERERETLRRKLGDTKHGARINSLMGRIRTDNVLVTVCVCVLDYLSSSLAPGGAGGT